MVISEMGLPEMCSLILRSRQVPAGLANVTTRALFTLKFVYNIEGKTYRHTVFVRENIRRFKSFKDYTEAVSNRENFINGGDRF